MVGWTPPARSASFFCWRALRSISRHSRSMVVEVTSRTLEFLRRSAIAPLPHRSGFSRLLVSHPLRAALDFSLGVRTRFLGTGATGLAGFYGFALGTLDLLAEDPLFAPFRFFAIEATRKG